MLAAMLKRNPARSAVFLVDKVLLVLQQKDVIKKQLNGQLFPRYIISQDMESIPGGGEHLPNFCKRVCQRGLQSGTLSLANFFEKDTLSLCNFCVKNMLHAENFQELSSSNTLSAQKHTLFLHFHPKNIPVLLLFFFGKNHCLNVGTSAVLHI